MKPNLKFLQKVSDGRVCATFSYSMNRGGYYGFRGGESTAKKYVEAGFVAPPRGGPSFGRPAYYTLTDAGFAALNKDYSDANPLSEGP